MNSLFILTTDFPYEGGEQFLESEINFWINSKFDNIYIIPDCTEGSQRPIPENIKVLKSKSRTLGFYFLRTLFEPILYKEISYIVQSKGLIFTIKQIKEILKYAILITKRKMILQNILHSHIKENITVYSYWSDISFYAACILKEKGVIDYLYSRAHGYDVYSERRANNYMPYKKQFASTSDKTFLLAHSALNYYSTKYMVPKNILSVSRLGVKVPRKPPSKIRCGKTVNILSISSCIPLKQINLIMDSVAYYASTNLDKKIKWVHIGDGPLYNSLKSESIKIMNRLKNLNIKFLGNLPNSMVHRNLDNNCYNVIINASKSEGVPVSIMEAMSYGIPAIAPNVGGISELVNQYNGYLMPATCTKLDIIYGLEKIISNEAKIDYRNNAYNWVSDNYNSEINYPTFISSIESFETN